MAYELVVHGAAFDSEGGEMPRKAYHYLEGHRIFSGYLSGPLPPSFLPNKIHLDTAAKSVDDVMVVGFGTLVSERFRLLVEEYEPDIHQFHLVEVTCKTGEVSQPYYIFFPGQRIDAILVTGTQPIVGEDGYFKANGKPGAYYYGFELRSDSFPNIHMSSDLTISSQPIAGKHIWVPDEVGRGVFISDVFYERLIKEKIRDCWYNKCIEVDEPWDRDMVVGPVLEARRKRRLAGEGERWADWSVDRGGPDINMHIKADWKLVAPARKVPLSDD